MVLLSFISLLSKLVLLTELACVNLAAKFLSSNILARSGILFGNSLTFVLRTVAVNKLLVPGILFSPSPIFVFKTD